MKRPFSNSSGVAWTGNIELEKDYLGDRAFMGKLTPLFFIIL